MIQLTFKTYSARVQMCFDSLLKDTKCGDEGVSTR